MRICACSLSNGRANAASFAPSAPRRAAYRRWKEQTLAYYAANAVKCTEPEELDRDERIAKRTAFLEKEVR